MLGFVQQSHCRPIRVLGRGYFYCAAEWFCRSLAASPVAMGIWLGNGRCLLLLASAHSRTGCGLGA